MLFMVDLLSQHGLLKITSFPYHFEKPSHILGVDICKYLLLDFYFDLTGPFLCQYTLFSLLLKKVLIHSTASCFT